MNTQTCTPRLTSIIDRLVPVEEALLQELSVYNLDWDVGVPLRHFSETYGEF